MKSSSKVQKKRKTFKDYLLSLLLTLIVLISPCALLILFCNITKFPPQIFGDNEDHFRGHIISPIPESVENLDVYFDDLLIHPDVSYYFRFSVNREDLNTIISYRKLRPSDTDCMSSFYGYEPEWWDISSLSNVEVYKYSSSGGTEIELCYHALNRTAYYVFWTY